MRISLLFYDISVFQYTEEHKKVQIFRDIILNIDYITNSDI